MKPRIGPIMKKALTFIREYSDCGGWCSFDQRPKTRKPIERLKAIGLVEINQFEQYRAITRTPKPATHNPTDAQSAVYESWLTRVGPNRTERRTEREHNAE